MVSPMARVIANNQLATMPLSAAGTTTLVLTSKRVPPIANAASRKLRGTARSESSERLATIGKIMIPTANPAHEVQTMTAYMVQIFTGDAPAYGIEYKSSFAVATVLFVITLALTVVGNLFLRAFREEYE